VLQSKNCSFDDGRQWSIYFRQLECSAVQKAHASGHQDHTNLAALVCSAVGKGLPGPFLFCEMVHAALWHELAALLSVQGFELTAEQLDAGTPESAPVRNKASLQMAQFGKD